MKDFLGKEVEIGDLVAFIYSPKYNNKHQLKLGKVNKITSLQIEVEIDDVFQKYRKVKNDSFIVLDKKCGTCNHYIGGGDWNLCCDIEHPDYLYGFLCYECTKACEKYEERKKKPDFTNHTGDDYPN